jgi:hypothetical protein
MLERYHYPDDGVPIYIIIFMEHGMDNIVNNKLTLVASLFMLASSLIRKT